MTTFLVTLDVSASFADTISGTDYWEHGNKNFSGSLYITSSGVLVNYGSGGSSSLTNDTGYFQNEGKLAVVDNEFVTVSGYIYQYGGQLGNLSAGGTLNFSSSITNVAGTNSVVYNAGSMAASWIYNNTDNVVYNQGTMNSSVTNYGTVANEGTWNGSVYNYAPGIFANIGTAQLNATTVSSSGTFYNEGTVSGTSLSVTDGQAANTGTINSNVSVSGGVFANLETGSLNRDVSVGTNGTLLNLGSINTTGGATGAFTNAGTAANAGSLTATTINSSGLLANFEGFTIHSNGSTTLSGQTLNYGTFSAGTTMSFTGGLAYNEGLMSSGSTMSIGASGAVINAGTLSAGGGLINQGALLNSGTVTGPTINSSGPLINTDTGIMTASTSFTLSGNTSNEGTLSSLGTMNVTGGNVLTSGTFSSVGAMSVSNGANLLNFGGVTASGGLTNSGGFVNGGTVTGPTISSSGALINLDTGIMTASTSFTLSGNTSNEGTLSSLGTMNVTGGNVLTSGTFSSVGAMSVSNGANLLNFGDVTATGGLTNAGGIANGGTVNGNTVNNNLVLNFAGGAFLGDMTNNATLSNEGLIDTTGGATGAFVNSSTGTALNTGTITALTVNSSGALINTGTGSITAQNAMTLSGQTSNEGLMNSLGTLDVTAGLVLNFGTLSSTGAMSVNNGATVASLGQVTATGGLTNAGTVLNAGIVTADVVNNNVIQNFITGSVLGDMTNNGTLVNDGQIITSGGSTGAFTNAGTAQNNGFISALTVDSSGAMQNTATGIVLAQNAITLSGTTVNEGQMVSLGTVAMTAGNTLNSGSLISSGSMSVSAGAQLANTGQLTSLSGFTNDGTVLNTGTFNADVTNNSLIQNFAAGQLIGDMTNAGALVNDGLIYTVDGTTGAFTNTGTMQNNGNILAQTFNSSNALENTATGQILAYASVGLSGTTFNDGVLGSLGTLDMTGGSTVNTGSLFSLGAMSVSNGVQLVNAGQVTSNGGLTNDGTVLNTGAITADVLNNNEIQNFAAGTIVGDMTNTATLVNQGLIVTTEGTTGAFVNTATTANTGDILATTFDSSGVVNNFAAGQILALGHMTLSGTTTNAGEMGSLGDLDMTAGQVQNTGTFGSAGVLTVASGALLVNMGTVIAQGDLINEGQTDNSASVIGNTFNTGLLNSDSGLFDGNLDNSALMNANGATVVTGAGVNTGTINMTDGAFGDTLSFGTGLGSATAMSTRSLTPSLAAASAAPALSGDGVYNTEIDLSLAPGGFTQSDYVIVRGGETTGDLTFNFTDLGSFYALQIDPIMVVDADENFAYSYTYTNSTKLPSTGLIFYSLTQDKEDLVIVSQVNPALGGFVATMNLTESLLGSLESMPDLGTCGTSTYARVTGGRSHSETDTDTGVSVFSNSVKMSYSGIEAGVGTGCNKAEVGSWDFAFGAFIGINRGQTEQLAYAIDPFDPTKFDYSTLNSIINTHFEHTFGGGYVTATNGPLSAKVELRFDYADFDITETLVNGAALGVDGQTMKSSSTTLAAQFAYEFALNQNGVSLTPFLGISHSRTDSGQVIKFATGESLSIESFDTTIVSVGATLAKTMTTDKTFNRPYFSLGYFEDVAGDRTSVFTDQNGTTQDLKTSGIGGYVQASVGADFNHVYSSGTAAPDKTVSMGLRADYKFGGSVSKGVNISAQVRITF